MSDVAEPRPTFSLVIPTHRRAEFVTQAVESAVRQVRPFDRIIVVADGLDDPAVQALADSAADVHAIEHRGVAAARNAGTAHADTDWVCFLDDDDLLHPSYLHNLEEAIREHPDAGAFNSPYWSFAAIAGDREEFAASTLDECLMAAETATPQNDMSYLQITGHSFDRLLAGLAGSMSTAAVRRQILIDAGGFPEGLIAAEDWTMYVNVARYTEWHVLPQRNAFFRDHGGNAMRSDSSEKGLSVLRAIRSFWRPTTRPVPPHRPLAAYGRGYRHEVLHALAACRRQDDRGGAREALQIADEILPRTWDRMFVRMPRPVRSLMWRMEKAS